MLDLCQKHLTQVRLYNVTSMFLVKRWDVLMKVAGSIMHLEVHQLRDDGIESLSKILTFLLNHKLKSFSLFSCKVQSAENLMILFTVLSKSFSTGTIVSSFMTDNSRDRAHVADDGNHKFESKTTELNKQMLGKCMENAEGLNYHLLTGLCTSNSQSDVCHDTSLANYSKQCGTAMADKTSCRSEDDLYEDIFSGNLELSNRDDISEKNATDEMFNSSYWTSKPSFEKCFKNFSPPNNEIQSRCLTELEMFSCFMSRTTLKMFSEALIHFFNLHTLKLYETGSGFFPEMNDLISNIKGLVMKGLLRHLIFENSTIDDRHGKMLCGTIVGSCKQCSTQNLSGLRSLHLVASGLGKTTADCMAEKIMSCSHCEAWDLDRTDSVLRHNVEHEPCNGLMNKVLMPEPDKGSTTNSVDILTVNNDNSQGKSGNTYSRSCSQTAEYDTKPMASHLATTICCGIESLYLSASVGTSGTASIARSLLHNRSLMNLSLPSCRLQTDDIAVIFNCIAGTSPTFTIL